jgi:aminoglycoside phosphotransferase (APT) family kinase protein
MSTLPSESVLNWAAEVLDTDAKDITAKVLHEGRTGPWWLRIDRGGETTTVVLRVVVPGWIGKQLIATGAAALRVAEEHGLAAPRLIASDLDGQATGGIPATLETVMAGSSALPPQVSVERLQAAGAAIAKVHTIPLEPQHDLPLRIRPTQVDDRAMERRWATLYQASPDNEKPAVVEALCELTGWLVDGALHVVKGQRTSPLLQLADDRIRDVAKPQRKTVFVHGDIWGGNMMWSGDTCLGLIDWKTAGAGDPGVDLGSLRMQMALQYGSDAPAPVLDGWQRESGRQATNVPYWDAVAALNTPAELHGWPGFDNQGNALDEPAVTARRDAFLREALDRLNANGTL